MTCLPPQPIAKRAASGFARDDDGDDEGEGVTGTACGAGRFLSRFLAGMPREVADSFTPAQLQAVQLAFGMRYAPRHALDVRRRVGLLGRRFYVVLLVGRDRADAAAPQRRYAACGIAAAMLGLALLLRP